jgi:hypothetical protein
MATEYAEKSREGCSYVDISKAESGGSETGENDAILASPYSPKGDADRDGEL